MKKIAVIVAGGSGQRMGGDLPKQFLLIHGKPILWYTLAVFLSAYEDMEILLMLHPDYLDLGTRIATDTHAAHRIRIIPGGETRFHSVQKGLSQIRDQSIIFIHDGVRCLLTKQLIQRCYEEALQFGSAIPCIDSQDSVRMLTEKGHEAVKRSNIKLVQTPQTFRSDLLLPAYQTEYRKEFTDDASVLESFQHRIHLVDGERNNIKITTQTDLFLAEKLLPANAAD